MDKYQFLKYTIEPTLDQLTLVSGKAFNGINASSLLLTTAIVESDCRYIHQIDGPAVSPFQIEPDTYKDIVENYLSYREPLIDSIHSVTGIDLTGYLSKLVLTNHLSLSTIIARLVYYRRPDALPHYLNESGQWYMYKKYYNTQYGSTDESEFHRAYLKMIAVIKRGLEND